jgi:DNA-binding Lrp family transcriptional regulator
MDTDNAPHFSESEKNILRIVQDTLPDSPTPFTDIAKSLGLQEELVIHFLNRLKDEGYIRRFGATLRHQEAGYGFNVMVAWYAENDHIETAAHIMSARQEITHCYLRDNSPEWPYNLYTMIHGKTWQDCIDIVNELQSATGLTQYELLLSDEELKKTSMQYF